MIVREIPRPLIHTMRKDSSPLFSITEKNGQPANEVQTSRLYDPQGHCIFEVKTNPKTKTDFYRRTRRVGIDGSIESDSLKYTDGRLLSAATTSRDC